MFDLQLTGQQCLRIFDLRLIAKWYYGIEAATRKAQVGTPTPWTSILVLGSMYEGDAGSGGRIRSKEGRRGAAPSAYESGLFKHPDPSFL